MKINLTQVDTDSSTKKFEIRPGEYQFKVVEITDKIDKNGKTYANIRLDVDIGSKYQQRCFMNIWNRKDFKDRKDGLDTLRDLVKTVGHSIDDEFDTKSLVGADGKASFTVEEYNGYTNLKYNLGCQTTDVVSEVGYQGDQKSPPSPSTSW